MSKWSKNRTEDKQVMCRWPCLTRFQKYGSDYSRLYQKKKGNSGSCGNKKRFLAHALGNVNHPSRNFAVLCGWFHSCLLIFFQVTCTEKGGTRVTCNGVSHRRREKWTIFSDMNLITDKNRTIQKSDACSSMWSVQFFQQWMAFMPCKAMFVQCSITFNVQLSIMVYPLQTILITDSVRYKNNKVVDRGGRLNLAFC